MAGEVPPPPPPPALLPGQFVPFSRSRGGAVIGLPAAPQADPSPAGLPALPFCDGVVTKGRRRDWTLGINPHSQQERAY